MTQRWLPREKLVEPLAAHLLVFREKDETIERTMQRIAAERHAMIRLFKEQGIDVDGNSFMQCLMQLAEKLKR